MEPVDNNQFEVVPTQKRKVPVPCPNAYLNPALDLLANEDPMCNTAMEILPNKKRKRSKSCDIIAFENSALDLGISKAAVNEFLAKELENVKRNIRYCVSEPSTSLHRIVDGPIQSDSDSFDPKIEIIEPGNSVKKYSQLSLSALSCNLTDINPEQVFETPNIDSDTKTAIAKPVYANLTDAELQMQEPSVRMPSSNTFEAQTINIDANNAKIIEQDMSTIPKPLDIKTDIQDCMDISRIDNVTDSGISVYDQKSSMTTNLENIDLSTINSTNIQTNITNQIFVNNTSNSSLSFIDRLALDSPNMSNQSLIWDDDLNESNIMEIKTITIITKKKRISDKKKNTNPFLDPELTKNLEEPINVTSENPFLSTNEVTNELEYNEEMINRPVQATVTPTNTLMPRRLFTSDINSTISTVNDSVDQNDHHEYENIDNYRAESPIYENVAEMYDGPYNKQSKILGCDVSQFSAIDIMNINKNSQANSSNESNDSKKDLKHKFLKTLRPKKMFKSLKKTFKGDKHASNQTIEHNVTLNPYEIPRKIPKDKSILKDTSGIENPALNLDTSDIEIEELDEYDDDEEHQYETIKTLRNTRLNMNVTPLKERNIDNNDISHNKTNTPGKKVRFDSTLNQEKIITGNSFDYDLQSPGFDSKIDKYHDELENCINERKFIQQNM